MYIMPVMKLFIAVLFLSLACAKPSLGGDARQGKKKRHQVRSACLNCRKKHAGCDEIRPCHRCNKLGIPCEEGKYKRVRSIMVAPEFMQSMFVEDTSKNNKLLGSIPADAPKIEVKPSAPPEPSQIVLSADDISSVSLWGTGLNRYITSAPPSSSNRYPSAESESTQETIIVNEARGSTDVILSTEDLSSQNLSRTGLNGYTQPAPEYYYYDSRAAPCLSCGRPMPIPSRAPPTPIPTPRGTPAFDPYDNVMNHQTDQFS